MFPICSSGKYEVRVAAVALIGSSSIRISCKMILYDENMVVVRATKPIEYRYAWSAVRIPKT